PPPPPSPIAGKGAVPFRWVPKSWGGSSQLAHPIAMAAAGALALARWPRLVAAVRPFHLGPPPSCAGHNRWSKVKNVKGPRDAARSRVFQRLGLMLRVAARGRD
uniref:Uncharacterized protein n=1 Tax=Accipiter nisus TaxID=211598 RepID=A0A8B9NDN9_9AVES